MTGYDRITFDPQILGGRACIRGMRLSVSLLVNLVAQGMTAEQIVSEYPALELDDVQQALQLRRRPHDTTIRLLALSHLDSCKCSLNAKMP